MAAVRPASAMRELRTDVTDPRTRGEQAGAALREPIAAVEHAYRRLFHAIRGWGEDDVARFGEQVLARVGRWRPALVTEMEGLAAGADRPVELVAALNGRTEVVRMHECSVIGRTESEDGPWLAQTWDWYVDAPGRTVMWNAVADDGARFLTMTEAGLLAKTGVSERGLALSLNMLSHREDALPPQIPIHLVLREILATCARVDDVAALLADVRFSASSTVTVVDADGGAASFECSPAGVGRIEPTDGLIAHTNHFLDAELANGEQNENLEGSVNRLAAVSAARPRTLAGARVALSNHSCTPQAVCRHDEPSLPGFANTGTCVALEMRPAAGELEAAAGNPCCTEFVHYAIA
jgi:isopenicillin-N N-acyltransferase-like protein